MAKFIALYMCPSSQLDAWMQTPEDTRKAEEAKMKAAWDEWLAAHGSLIKETAGAGKTKRVTKGGIEDARNDIMLYSVVEADSHEAAADAFKDHPHFGIPGAWIDVMPANVLPGMQS